jgi:2-polyprenyl-3-methyl-5-hydroxy-6-metoxy-1,4-benzoquinol methylase
MYKIDKKQLQTIYKCPACNQKNFIKISDIFYKNKFSFFTTSYCKTCTLIFRSKRPKESWFIKNWNLRHNIQKKNLVNFLNPQIEKDRKKRYQLILGKIISKNQKILDIGCGPGTGLKAFVKRNIVHGIEPDISRAKIAKKNKIKVFNYSLKDFFKKKKKKYDVIILFHTLEHMFNPKETIKIIERLLTKNGKLIIEVPNFKDYVKSWHDALYLAHNQNFNLLSLNKLLIKEKFLPTEIFYTRYKNQEKNICSVYIKKIAKKEIEKELLNLLDIKLNYRKVKKIYNNSHSKCINININEINDLSLTYKPSMNIHRNIRDNIIERKIKFNKKIKKYEVFNKTKVNIINNTINNNYELFLDKECIKINNFLKKINKI